MQQFDDEAYNTEFKTVTHVNQNTVRVTMKDDSVWTVIRSDNFMEPPQILRFSQVIDMFCDENWSPALTSVKALLIAHQERPYGPSTLTATIACGGSRIYCGHPECPDNTK